MQRAGALFAVETFGQPFERRLLAFAIERDGATELSFVPKLKPKLPLVFAVILALTVWPGWPLTDDLLDTYSDWYAEHVRTWWWYVPMLIISVPALLGMWRKSQREAHSSALEQIVKIASEVSGTVEGADPAEQHAA